MHVLLLPETGSGTSTADPRRPDFGGLPAFTGHGQKWTQRSSMQFGVHRMRCVGVGGVSDADIDDLLDAVPRAQHVQRVASAQDFTGFHDGLRAQAPRWAESEAKREEIRAAIVGGASAATVRRLRAEYAAIMGDVIAFHRTPAREYTDAFRSTVAALEKTERETIYNLVTLHQDTFTRADATLNGSTMSDGIGTWVNDISTISVVSNQAKVTNASGGDAASEDNAMSAVAEQRSQGTTQAAAIGCIVRYTVAANTGYLAFRAGTNVVKLYRIVLQSTYTQLGSDGSSIANADTIACDADSGTNISALKNGSVDVGPISDATYANGKAGIYGGLNGILDDWSVLIAGGVTPASRRVNGGLVTGGNVQEGRLVG